VAQVVSGGELLEVRRPFSSGLSHSTGWMRMYGEYNADYATIYRTQPNVRRVISFLANNHAQLKIKAYDRVSDDERKHLRDHPAARLIRKPNPYLTRYNYARALMSDLAIYDDSFTVKIRLGGVVRMLLPIPPSWVSFDGKTPFWSSGYKIKLGGLEWIVPDEDMIHIHGYNPTDPRRGLSPMEALRRMLAQEDAQGRFQESFWRNNAKHETVITRPATAPKWSETARERFTAEWRKNYSGADNSGKTPVLEEGMDVKTVSVSAKDSEYIASRKFSLEEAAGVYHVSPPLIGLLDEANFGSLTAIYRQHLANTLAPWTVNIQEEFELHLLSEFESPDTSVYMEYNLQEKLRGFFEEEASVLQTATGGPIMTRNEARGRWNLPPVPDGDLLITPLNVLVGGQASPTDSAPPKSGPSEAYLNVLKNHLNRQEKALGRLVDLGATALESWDRKRWDTELTKDLLVLGNGDSSQRLEKASQVAQTVNETVQGFLGSELSIPEAFMAARSAVLGGNE
jgi:HK97 family phage portal protein